MNLIILSACLVVAAAQSQPECMMIGQNIVNPDPCWYFQCRYDDNFQIMPEMLPCPPDWGTNLNDFNPQNPCNMANDGCRAQPAACMMLGQFMVDPDPCWYFQCRYDANFQIMPESLPCPPGWGTNLGNFNMQNPCNMMNDMCTAERAAMIGEEMSQMNAEQTAVDPNILARGCMMLGQFLVDPDPCWYLQCRYEDNPMPDENGNFPITPTSLPCPPGWGTNLGNFNMQNPCNMMNDMCTAERAANVAAEMSQTAVRPDRNTLFRGDRFGRSDFRFSPVIRGFFDRFRRPAGFYPGWNRIP